MDTIAAIATPAGRGGVGVIRISGSQAEAIARRLCGTDEELKPRYARYANFLDADGGILDAGIVLFFRAPASYTGEHVAEIQAHGSPVLLRALLERILELGARQADPGEFSRRAVRNGKLHLEQAEAIADCINADTLRAARQAQRHLQGEFGLQVSALLDEITNLVAHVEACLDFPEEEIPQPLFRQLRSSVRDGLLQPIDRVLATSAFGERLFQGASIAILGAPNVGKSTLLNRLAGRERAIVSPKPGTTRDILEVDFELYGIPLRLLDTAGLRDSSDDIEHEGIQRARQAGQSADLTIAMADASDSKTWEPLPGADVYVMNKCDLIAERHAFPERYRCISASTGEGVEELLGHLARRLGDVPTGEEGILVTSRRHRQQIERAKEHLLKGEAMLDDAISLDLVALEWRRAWSCLAEILGVGDVEHILDRVFSRFCIGK